MNVKQISIMNFREIREYHAKFRDGVVLIDEKNADAIMAAIDIVTSGEGLDALPEETLITAEVQIEDDVLFVTADRSGISAYCALDNMTDEYRQMIGNRVEERKRRFFNGDEEERGSYLDEYLRGESLPSESEVGSLPFFHGIIRQYIRRERDKAGGRQKVSIALNGYKSFIETLNFWRDYKEMQNFHIEMQPVFISNLLSQQSDELLRKEIVFEAAAMHRQVFLS